MHYMRFVTLCTFFQAVSHFHPLFVHYMKESENQRVGILAAEVCLPLQHEIFLYVIIKRHSTFRLYVFVQCCLFVFGHKCYPFFFCTVGIFYSERSNVAGVSTILTLNVR